MRHHPEYGVCNRCPRRTELIYSEIEDEYLCEECLEQVAENQAEAAWERHNEAMMGDGPETAREEQLRTWREHQEAHKR